MSFLWQENVTAVLTASSTDVLSHVAIRARSQNVLLATCFEPEQLHSLRSLEGSTAVAHVDASGAVAVSARDSQASHLHLVALGFRSYEAPSLPEHVLLDMCA